MALTNNTNFRRVDLTINKKVNGSLQTSGGFPKEHSITDAFDAYPAITDADLQVMNEPDYTTRLNAFYTFLETTYDFFDRSQMLNTSSGTDAVLCPLDNSPAPTLVPILPPTLGFEPVYGGQADANLTWTLNITEATPQDASYSFDVNIRDKNNNLLTTERLYGIIRAGRTYHSSLPDDGHYIYFAEAENPALAPLIAEYVPGSITIEI